MNIAFFLDAKLIKKENIYYTSGAATKEYLNRHRYSEQDKLIVICREESSENVTMSQLSIASDENITFLTCHSYKDVWKERKQIEKIIKQSDLIHIKLPTIIGLLAMHYAIKYKTEHVVQMVGCPFDSLWNYGNLKGKILAPILYLANRHYLKRAKNVIYVTNEFLQKRYPTEGKSISCSDVNIEEAKEETIQKRLNKIRDKEGSYKIGLIGSLNVNYKGHKEAIEAISLLKDKYNIELHFLGKGNTEKWKQLAKKLKVENNVFFDGILPSGKPVFKWLDELDIYLIPSLQEGLPRALIEAMSRGCPSIGTKTGGIPELLQKEYICPKRDYKEIANKIRKLCTNKEEMLRIANENYVKIKEQYNKEILNERRNKFLANFRERR